MTDTASESPIVPAAGVPVTNVYVQQPHAAALPPKSVAAAYWLWFFFGAIGVHQFYLGKTGRGVGYLFTLGWLTVGLWIDLFTLPSQVRVVNAQRAVGIG